MAVYDASFVSNNTVNASPSWDLKAGGANTPRVMEVNIAVSVTGATSSFGLGRPANDGSVSQSGATAFQADDPNMPASQSFWATAWTVAPTLPTRFFRRIFLPNTQSAGVIFTFPRGLLVGTNDGLVSWNLSVATAQVAVGVALNE